MTYWELRELRSKYLQDLVLIGFLLGLPALLSKGFAFTLVIIPFVGSAPHIVKYQKSISWWITRGCTRSWFAWNLLCQVVLYSAASGLGIGIFLFFSLYSPFDRITDFRTLSTIVLYAFLISIMVRCAVGLMYLTRISVCYPRWMRSLGMNEPIAVGSVWDWLRFFGGTAYAFLLLGTPVLFGILIVAYPEHQMLLSCVLASLVPLYLIYTYYMAKHAEYHTGSSRRTGPLFQIFRQARPDRIPNRTFRTYGLIKSSMTFEAGLMLFLIVIIPFLIFILMTYDAVAVPPEVSNGWDTVVQPLIVSLVTGFSLVIPFSLLIGKGLLTWDRDRKKQAYLYTRGVSIRTLVQIRTGIGLVILAGTIGFGILVRFWLISDTSWLALLITGLLLHRAAAILFHYAEPPVVRPVLEGSVAVPGYQIINWLERWAGSVWMGIGVVTIAEFLLYQWVSWKRMEQMESVLFGVSLVVFLLVLPLIVASTLKALATLHAYQRFD